VIAPIAMHWGGEGPSGQLLNINADTVAGAIAGAIRARWLFFLTDVPGVRSSSGEIASRLSTAEATDLIDSRVIEGGMIPKVQACFDAASAGCESVIIDGREEHALMRGVDGQISGTVVG
jgi:acetylglutamate kinase